MASFLGPWNTAFMNPNTGFDVVILMAICGYLGSSPVGGGFPAWPWE